MIKTLIFDLDDTLYNERDFVYGAFKDVAVYLSKKYNLNNNNVYEDIINIFIENGRGKIFNILCDKYKLNHNINELINIYRKSKPPLELYDDSKDVIRKYKDKYKLAIITDGKASVQWNKIHALQLENYFEKIIVTDEFGEEYWKPNEFCFKEIVKYFNVNSNQCIYIGDNPNKDFIGAKNIGMHTVRIVREDGDHMKTVVEKGIDADYKISNLNNIEVIIQSLNKLI